MTDLTRKVKRVSAGMVREAGKERQVVIVLEPPSLLGFRAKGCRKTYYLDAATCYKQAVAAEVAYQKKMKKKKKRSK